MDKDNALYVKSVANGMFNGWIFYIKLRARKVFIVRAVRLKSNYKMLLIAESEGKE